jgi:Tfp pilus assembly major pilin PilA
MKNGFKKVISIIIVILLVVIVAAAILINIYGDAALKAGIETAAGKALKVNVTIGDVALAIWAGKLNINNLVVDNPEGYQNPTFLELGHGFVDLKTSSLLSDTIEIDTLQLDNVHLTIEQKGLTSNLSEILNNLPKAEKTAEEQPKEEKPGKKLLIKQLDIEGIKVTAKLLPVPGRADNLTLDLAPIHMENVGSGEKLDTSKLVAKILLAIAGGIAEKGKDILPTEMLNNIGGQLTEQGMKILESGQNVGKEILGTGKDIGEQATETLKGLLPKKKEE